MDIGRIPLRAAAAATALALALGASACGSSSSSSGGSSSASTGSSGSSTSASGGSSTSSSSAPSSSGKSYQLTGTAGLANDAFWISLQCGGTQQAKKEGSTIKWYASSSGTDSTIINQTIQGATLGNPQGVILSPVGSVNNTATLHTLAAKHIPVIETNSSEGTPFYEAVESPQKDPSVVKIAQLIAKNAGGTGTVGILAGVAAVPAINYRWQPLVAELKKVAPKMKVLPVQYDNFDSSTTASDVSSELTANPDMKAIWDTSGPEGIGVASAVKAAGKAGKVDVYSYDAEPNELQQLREGVITALLAQSPYNQGAAAVKDMIALLNTGKAGSSATTSPKTVLEATKIITQANAKTPAAAHYEYKTSCS